MNIAYSTVSISSSHHKCLISLQRKISEGLVRRPVAVTAGRTTAGSQARPEDRRECGLKPSSNNPVLGLGVGGLCFFFLELRWLLLPEP